MLGTTLKFFLRDKLYKQHEEDIFINESSCAIDRYVLEDDNLFYTLLAGYFSLNKTNSQIMGMSFTPTLVLNELDQAIKSGDNYIFTESSTLEGLLWQFTTSELTVAVLNFLLDQPEPLPLHWPDLPSDIDKTAIKYGVSQEEAIYCCIKENAQNFGIEYRDLLTYINNRFSSVPRTPFIDVEILNTLMFNLFDLGAIKFRYENEQLFYSISKPFFIASRLQKV
ncbi:hypothetical protein C4D02_RS21595 [Vibrio parahaemolyticus]|uniref:hypothetical protein n=1 Tax=Vibrio parahaemolyticus TaxID=670 RepID=UPI001D294B8D|nr:hypothetical protein [Vibrio parahaemolyticus]EGQ8302678.1 hypothetical protein [Vibrio parahaemolyticus]EGR3037781.1 hypothetical protein [Vibrio parahaemolyticus]EGR3149987.1 hypothetical protein [Vibrio parahaemolyticus]EGR3164389.1 hypothetical protein [Vibrio parahaemolyticus]EIE1188630.1 hypothetical protein [Vibrio parahaemolyticus]